MIQKNHYGSTPRVPNCGRDKRQRVTTIKVETRFNKANFTMRGLYYFYRE